MWREEGRIVVLPVLCLAWSNDLYHNRLQGCGAMPQSARGRDRPMLSVAEVLVLEN